MDACEATHVEIFILIFYKYLMKSTVQFVGTVLRIGYRKYTERTAKSLRSELQYVYTADYRNAPCMLSITVVILNGFVQ
jgi:hypothetical protein